MQVGETLIYLLYFVVYKEPAGDYGWYEDAPTRAGKQIRLMKMKDVKRYGHTRLKDMGVCTDKTCK